ncbi:MAG: peptidase S8, partial [Chryseobacterium sp.]|nr:peptidase S8 [Chryseobacterium sp.]
NFKSQSDEKPFINNMIVVGSNTNDANALKSSFSNYDEKMVDVFAPGSEIYSTVPDGKYEYLQGTSMASPVVAGSAAVLLAYMPNLKPEQIIESLVKTTNVNTTNGFDKLSRSNGVIDVAKAAEYAYKNFYKAEAPSKSVKKPVKKKTHKAIDKSKL